MNTKLMNVAIVLVIVCAVAFLALWAAPRFMHEVSDGAQKLDEQIVQPVVEEQQAMSESRIRGDIILLAQQRNPDKLIMSSEILFCNWNPDSGSGDLAVTMSNTDGSEPVDMHYEFSLHDGVLTIDNESTVEEMYDVE